MFRLHPSTVLISPGGGHHRLSDLHALGHVAMGTPVVDSSGGDPVSLGSKDTDGEDRDVGSYDYNDSFIAPEGSVEPSASEPASAAAFSDASLGSQIDRGSVMSPAPKPPTTWQTFCKAERAASKAALGANALHAEVMRHLGSRWKAMSGEERAAYAHQ